MSNPAKPTALKKMEGTFRVDRQVENEMGESLTNLEAIPEPPDTIQGKMAKGVWYSVANELMHIGIFHQVGLPLLEIYCIHYEIAIKAKRDINKNGIIVDGGKNPAISIFNDSSAHLLRLGNAFGFTPSSASRIKLPTVETTTDPFDLI